MCVVVRGTECPVRFLFTIFVISLLAYVVFADTGNSLFLWRGAGQGEGGLGEVGLCA